MNDLKLDTKKLIETLQPYQKEIIDTLLKTHSVEEVIEIWENVSGPEHTAKFGGIGNSKLLKNFKIEFNKLILEDEKYKKDIETLKGYKKITEFLIVSNLSTALSESLGVASNVVAPLVVLFLELVMKIGLNAYKESLKEQEKNDTEKNK